jgi:hypothetical protein
MNRTDEDRALEDVLDAYVAESGAPSYETLTAWTRRYPRYERELADFTAAWSLMRWLPPSTTAEVDEAALVQRGMSTVRAMLRERADRQTAIVSLLEAGKERGLATGALAARAGLSVPLVLKLDRRLIRVATVPARVIEGLAAAIGRDAASVAAYLQGAPRLAAGASYHAGATPTLAGQEDFADAVRGDLTLSDEQRARLLAAE